MQKCTRNVKLSGMNGVDRISTDRDQNRRGTSAAHRQPPSPPPWPIAGPARDLPPVSLVQQFDDSRRRNAGHLIKQRLWKLMPMMLNRLGPSFVMQRHGIGDGSVAIKDQAADVGRDVDHDVEVRTQWLYSLTL